MSIKVEKISFKYDEENNYVLRNFSAEFHEGKITALVGPNGSGKTTLSRIIMGILKPNLGEIIIDEKNTKKFSLAEMGRQIGYVMQNPARQIFSTKVKEEIEYGLLNKGMAQAKIDERVAKYLAYFDLEKHEEDFPFTLSHGEKQRLVLAAVLAIEPKYLMLDEPTAALDYKRKEVLGNYLIKICQEKNCGIVLISHDREFVEKYADDVLKIRGGKNV